MALLCAGSAAALADPELASTSAAAGEPLAAYAPPVAGPVLQPDPATLPTPPGADDEPPSAQPQLPPGHRCRNLPPHEMETCITRTRVPAAAPH